MADLMIQISALDGPFDWVALFGNASPVEVEIGCGKGRFLIASAMQYPDVNYVGIERAVRYFRIVKERVARRALTNVRLLCDDAGYFVRKFIPDGSIGAYHVYFPDPWPKKRHRKRRLFQGDFPAHLARTLCAEGTIDLATDYEEYFSEIVSLLDACPGLRRMSGLPDRVRLLGTGVTNFEVKYTAEGRLIYRAAFRKTDDGFPLAQE
ncbi:MAG: tRNA (guanosine(46)-N7)-methyltransferase TrmB [Candidatus Latescibacteria bacterium]|nr:tRNA (guanosine(46)-N7)-methyltransferase TrmB [Candidatus Latescibacterota bacterium]